MNGNIVSTKRNHCVDCGKEATWTWGIQEIPYCDDCPEEDEEDE